MPNSKECMKKNSCIKSHAEERMPNWICQTMDDEEDAEVHVPKNACQKTSVEECAQKKPFQPTGSKEGRIMKVCKRIGPKKGSKNL